MTPNHAAYMQAARADALRRGIETETGGDVTVSWYAAYVDAAMADGLSRNAAKLAAIWAMPEIQRITEPAVYAKRSISNTSEQELDDTADWLCEMANGG